MRCKPLNVTKTVAGLFLWKRIELYRPERTQVKFSHGIDPDRAGKPDPDLNILDQTGGAGREGDRQGILMGI